MQALKENKVIKYLIYAIGEILLIVIGILIALQINNWNDAKQKRVEEISVLEGIKQNLQADSLDLADNLKMYHNKKSNDSLFLSKLINNKPYSDSVSNQVAGLYLSDLLIVLHKSAFEEAKANGLDIISNVLLRDRIRRLYEFDYAYLERIENEDDDVFRQSLDKYFMDLKLLELKNNADTTLRTLHLSEANYNILVKDKHFHSLLGIQFKVHEHMILERYEPIIDENEKIIAAIEEELSLLRR